MTTLTSLDELYEFYSNTSNSNCDENLDQASSLRQLANQCSSVLELGVHDMRSCVYILKGLMENNLPGRSYDGVDLRPTPPCLAALQSMGRVAGISVNYHQATTFDFTLNAPVDLLHIDAYHSYRHVTYELETFSSLVRKFIIIHDTSWPFGYVDQDANLQENRQILQINLANESKLPAYINREKQGTWTAVQDFLSNHPEWFLQRRSHVGTGLTVLQRDSIHMYLAAK